RAINKPPLGFMAIAGQSLGRSLHSLLGRSRGSL
ncbi:MAG: hypothetical protein ACI8Q1_001296, partial [Parvicella sp.]